MRGVDQCWDQKKQFYEADELEEAEKAYEYARTVYRKIVSESEID